MADYWVYSGAAGSNDGSSWTNAWTSWDQAGAVTALTGANRIFVADDHVDAGDGAAKTHTGPTTGEPCVIISADRTDNAAVPAYKKGTTAQFNTTDGAYALTPDGSFAFYGVRFASGAGLILNTDNNERGMFVDCDFVAANGVTITIGNVSGGRQFFYKCRWVYTADSGNTAVSAVTHSAASHCEIIAPTFVDCTYRTGMIFQPSAGTRTYVSGADLSGFSNATLCEPAGVASLMVLLNCKLTAAAAAAPATFGALGNNQASDVRLINCGTADSPEYLYYMGECGTVASDTAVTRSGGASVEGVSHSWKMTSNTQAGEHCPLYTPWMYGTTTNGTKTFTVYTANNTADLTDAECWLEVEAMATADSPLYAFTTDRRATITTTPVAQTDDTADLWAGATLTYQQILSCASVTVGESGIYRARVGGGKASATVYIDPKVVVS